MYDDKTGQPTFQGILVIAALILALFAFEVAEPGKKNSSSNVQEKAKTSAALANVILGELGFIATSRIDSSPGPDFSG
jgi:hypothetical protein